VQEDLLRSYAAQHGYTVTATYCDSASGRSVKHRTGFIDLIETVKAGAPFEVILVRDVSRWGRFPNVDEAGYWEFVCLLNHVRVIYVEEAFSDGSPVGTLMKALERWKAAEYSLERGRLTKRGRAWSVGNGFFNGAPCPYGMKRVLVDRNGRFIQELADGERKAILGQHVKLAPGPPSEIAAVRKMFSLYVEGFGRCEIATYLRDHGILSRKGFPWTWSNVTSVLRNEAYIGTSRVRVDGEVVRARDAWEGIIDLATWNRAVTQLALDREVAWRYRDGRQHRSLPVLEHAYERHYAVEVTAGLEALRLELKAVLNAGGRTRLGSSVSFVGSFGHVVRGRPAWKFALDRDADVTIGVGFTAPPEITRVATYFFDHRFVKASTLYPMVGYLRGRCHALDITGLTRRLSAHIVWEKVAARVAEAISDLPLLNMAELARTLAWPSQRTRQIVKGLEKRGMFMPPLLIRPGRRVTVVCNVCGLPRQLRPGLALRRKSDTCGACVRVPGAGDRVVVRCPFCKLEREDRRSNVAGYSAGVNTPCRRCSFTRRTLLRHRKRRKILKKRINALHAMAQQVVVLLKAAFPTHRRVELHRVRDAKNPHICWTTEDGSRCRLRLRATDDAVRRGIDVARHAQIAARPESWDRHPGGWAAGVTFIYTVR
jgi:DNA invertase Pin-like site-specific DNA recombinase